MKIKPKAALIAAKIAIKSRRIIKKLCPDCKRLSFEALQNHTEKDVLEKYCPTCRTKVQRLMEVFD